MCNARGQLDGLGIRITPGKQIQIAYYHNDRREGNCVTVFASGEMWYATYQSNVLIGKVEKIKAGEVENYFYQWY